MSSVDLTTTEVPTHTTPKEVVLTNTPVLPKEHPSVSLTTDLPKKVNTLPVEFNNTIAIPEHSNTSHTQFQNVGTTVTNNSKTVFTASPEFPLPAPEKEVLTNIKVPVNVGNTTPVSLLNTQVINPIVLQPDTLASISTKTLPPVVPDVNLGLKSNEPRSINRDYNYVDLIDGPVYSPFNNFLSLYRAPFTYFFPPFAFLESTESVPFVGGIAPAIKTAIKVESLYNSTPTKDVKLPTGYTPAIYDEGQVNTNTVYNPESTVFTKKTTGDIPVPTNKTPALYDNENNSTAATGTVSPAVKGESSEYKNVIPNFLASVLSQPAGSLPKEAQWIVTWSAPTYGSSYFQSGIPQVILQVGDYEPQFAGLKWNIQNAFNALVTDTYNGSHYGCMFAQSINIPGESLVANPEGIQKNGFVQTYIGQGRNLPGNLTISFLATNVDFVDNVIRPWVVMTSHLGLISRPASKSYRTNVIFYKLGITSSDAPPTIAAKYSFYGVCPTSVAAHEYAYTPYTAPIRKNATFIYHYYTIDSSTNAFAQTSK